MGQNLSDEKRATLQNETRRFEEVSTFYQGFIHFKHMLGEVTQRHCKCTLERCLSNTFQKLQIHLDI